MTPFPYTDLVGKPFAAGGRGPDAYDCWGVLREIANRRGLSPTDYPSQPASFGLGLRDEWRRVPEENALPGDGVLLRSTLDLYVWHIGVLVAPGKMLHARESAGVCVEFIDPAYRRRVVGFYRFRGAM